MGGLKKLALLVGFVLMSLETIFHVHIGYIWMLVPFIIFASLAGWHLLKSICALIYGFSTKGWDRTMSILEENSNAQKRIRKMSEETLERCRNKLLE